MKIPTPNRHSQPTAKVQPAAMNYPPTPMFILSICPIPPKGYVWQSVPKPLILGWGATWLSKSGASSKKPLDSKLTIIKRNQKKVSKLKCRSTRHVLHAYRPPSQGASPQRHQAVIQIRLHQLDRQCVSVGRLHCPPLSRLLLPGPMHPADHGQVYHLLRSPS